MLLNRKGMTGTLYCWRIPWRDYGLLFTMTAQYLWASRRAGNILLQQTTSRPGMSASLLRSQTMMSRCTLSGCVVKFKIPLHRCTSLRWAKLCDFFTYQSINWDNSWLFCSFPNNPLRLASVQASGKHASVELLGRSCEYNVDLPFLQEVVGKPCGSGVSAWAVTGELLTIHILEL